MLLFVHGCGGTPVGSIGAVLARDGATGAVHVREAPEGRAAADAGIIPGDRVKMVDGVLIDDADPARIRTLLRGAVDSEVTLTIIRGDEVLHLVVRRKALSSGASAERGRAAD